MHVKFGKSRKFRCLKVKFQVLHVQLDDVYMLEKGFYVQMNVLFEVRNRFMEEMVLIRKGCK